MKGSIRFILGFLIMAGSVGTLEINPEASVIVQLGISLVGALVMVSGVKAMKNS